MCVSMQMLQYSIKLSGRSKGWTFPICLKWLTKQQHELRKHWTGTQSAGRKLCLYLLLMDCATTSIHKIILEILQTQWSPIHYQLDHKAGNTFERKPKLRHADLARCASVNSTPSWEENRLGSMLDPIHRLLVHLSELSLSHGLFVLSVD